MSMRFQAVGIRGEAGFDRIVEHFTSMGGEVVLMNPDMVAGRRHLVSAAQHAERAFASGRNRSKSILSEILMYCAWERQVGRALSRMRPAEGATEFAALLIDIDDPRLEEIGMVRDDSLLDADEGKAARLGLTDPFVPAEEQAVENVAMVDLMKQ